MRSWYADENALVRQRIQESMLEHIALLLNDLIGEAVREGTLYTPYPDMAGQIILALMVRLGDAFAQILFAPDRSAEICETTRRIVAAYNDAIERVLGAAAGSLQLMMRKPSTSGLSQEVWDDPSAHAGLAQYVAQLAPYRNCSGGNHPGRGAPALL
ncbi:MAG: hypothetical protein HGA65_18905 [Oscillochloris sp.]|nr:hypothetical protein [Oscillochloris sp.]